MKITSPCRGKLTITQGPHHYKVGRKIVQRQFALDLSPRFPWTIGGVIKAPLKGKITHITRRVEGVRDGYFVLKTEDGFSHFFVHANIWNKVPLGWKTKQGGKLGWIDKEPVNGEGSHLHYFIQDPKGRPVRSVIEYYEQRGLPQNKWLRDPLNIIQG